MVDPLLRGFVDATNEEDAERHLEWLLDRHLRPLLRKIVARKLSGPNARNQSTAEDLEDVVGDAILLLLKRLRAMRREAESAPIESLEGYAAAVAYSACAHRLRRKYPERSRLKNRLRYLLVRNRQFAVWEVPSGECYCGPSAWRDRTPDQPMKEKLRCMEQTPDDWPSSWTRQLPADGADPRPLIADIFDRIGGAIELDRLVGLVASIWRIDRAPQIVGTADAVADAGSSPDVSLEQRRHIERLWDEIQRLPLRQRVALLLNLRDRTGAGMLWILPVTGVASMRAIAKTLEMPVGELAELWRRLPIDDAALAERLGCTRQQVINLRMSARKRLRNRAAHDSSLSSRPWKPDTETLEPESVIDARRTSPFSLAGCEHPVSLWVVDVDSAGAGKRCVLGQRGSRVASRVVDGEDSSSIALQRQRC
jgi:RNA polymerase sigma factor (sigma-70 family)